MSRLLPPPSIEGVMSAGRNVDCLWAVQGVDFDRSPQHGLRIGDLQLAEDVRAFAREVRMGLDRDVHVEVAGRSTAAAVLALPHQTQSYPGLDPGRDLDLDGALTLDAALARALAICRR